MAQSPEEKPLEYKIKHLGKWALVIVCALVVAALALVFFLMTMGRTVNMQVLNREMTILTVDGERTGTYSGGVNKGVPDGNGRFESSNPNGVSWTYKGSFTDGLFDGKGNLSWSTGYSLVGTFSNGVIERGTETDSYGNILYKGAFDKEGNHRDNFLKKALRLKDFQKNYFEADWNLLADGAVLGEAVQVKGVLLYWYAQQGGTMVDYYLAVDGDSSHILVCTLESPAGGKDIELGTPVIVRGYFEAVNYVPLYGSSLTSPLVYVIDMTVDEEAVDALEEAQELALQEAMDEAQANAAS